MTETSWQLESCLEARLPLDRLAAVLGALIFVALLLRSVVVCILAVLILSQLLAALLLFVASSLIVAELPSWSAA